MNIKSPALLNYIATSQAHKPNRAGAEFMTREVENTGDRFDYGIDDGKISPKSKALNLLKGVVSPFTAFFTSAKGFFTGCAMLVAGSALMIATSGAIAPFMVALGVVGGTLQLGAGVVKAASAKTDKEAENAWRGIGCGISTTAGSVLFSKAALKEAGTINNSGFFASTLKCFKKTPSSLKETYSVFKTGNAIKNIRNYFSHQTPKVQESKAADGAESDFTASHVSVKRAEDAKLGIIKKPTDKPVKLTGSQFGKSDSDVLTSYQNDHTLNDLLRKNLPLSDKQKNTVRVLDKLSRESAPLPEEAVVYRGVMVKSEKSPVSLTMDMFKEGSIIPDRSYVSTSKSGIETVRQFDFGKKGQALAGEGVIMRIRLPEGTRGIDTGRSYSQNYLYNDEFILPRESKIRVVSMDLETRIAECEYILP